MKLLSADGAIIYAARQMLGRDFEDNVQIACAGRVQADLIVTRDAEDFRHSPIPGVDAQEALRRITAE